MHLHSLSVLAGWLRGLSILLAVCALLCGIGIEYQPNVARWRAPNRTHLPDPRHLTPRGRRFYFAVFQLFASALLVRLLAWLVAGFNHTGG